VDDGDDDGGDSFVTRDAFDVIVTSRWRSVIFR